jgi:hypothetical protein
LQLNLGGIFMTMDKFLCRNPLTGLCGLQLYPPKNAVLDGTARGGFVRKMKLGICMGRITGVFGGLCR